MASATAKYIIRLEDKTKRAFKAIGRSLKKVTKAIFSMKTGLISAAGIAGLGFLIKRSMDATDEMAKMSRAVGVSVEELQGLRHAAALGGLASTQLDKAVQKLAINMADMSRGVGLAKDVFEKHNISVTKTDGSLRSVMDVMGDVADVTAGMTNETEKADLAYKLFGARGAKMINMLNGGSDAMHTAMKEAESLGIVMSKDTAEGVEKANDAITRLKSFLGASFTRMVAELAPAIEKITDGIRAWVTMKVDKAGGIGMIAKQMASSILQATDKILMGIEMMGNGMIKFANTAIALKNFSTPLHNIKADMEALEKQMFFIGTKEGMATLAQGAVSQASMMAHLVGRYEDLEAQLNDTDDGQIRYTVSLKKQRDAIYDLIRNLTVSKGIHHDLGGTLKKETEVVDGVTKSYRDLNDTLGALIPNYELVGRHMDKNNALADDGTGIWSKMKDGFEAYFDSVSKGTLSIASITQGVMTTAEDAIVNMMMGVKTNWKSLFKAILADIIRLQVRKAAVSILGGIFGFANGGRPPTNRPSIVGEKGAELFVPDSAGTIVPNNQLGGGGNTTAEINFNVQAIDASSFNSFLVSNRDTIESIINNSITTNGTVRRTIQMAG